jgi:eukaryotic-like serine/threonine-protein kinase
MPDDKKQKTMFLDEGAAGAPPPRANQPLSSQSTMMIDAARESPGGARQMVVPTMMKEAPRQQLPPMQRPPKPSTWGRWVAGPIVALLVAAGTAALANVVLPSHKKGTGVVKPQGKLRVNTEPPGASITVDGKRFPRFTPAVIEGDIGATLKLTFTMEGFKPHEADVYVAEGEHPFNVHLQPVAATTTPPVPEPVAPKKEHHHSSSKPAKAEKEAAGEATISIRVRPWAIVFVDKQRLKQTPVLDYKIPSGKHTIELANESKNRREKIEINLKPGEEQEISRDWDK